MAVVDELAPAGEAVVDYDQRNLALYAALIDAHDAGIDWRIAAADLMGLDPSNPEAENCWRSHLERAQWIVGDGMAAALVAFGKRKLPENH
ncbi:hypothetical protein M527_11705 [Sphingobium indicum IP26]|uniref:DUF2285 domain-containing protein n=1 Tax=Sphingobium indicum F2 TaxID=1450518 RepID=A0A8E0WRP3_9SPHN|nr:MULTISPECIES: hypothetical protein [Sphingobium]EPR18826.1 hypothetical protein M527_11705 [Sphingobium indicum IP26]EQB01006.1 hypothetical protein L286_16520 [Sphingobium sp. HDIP04]KER36147.1 hypothetical protein AL00_12910 [Sphingobium indicum F2]